MREEYKKFTVHDCGGNSYQGTSMRAQGTGMEMLLKEIERKKQMIKFAEKFLKLSKEK